MLALVPPAGRQQPVALPLSFQRFWLHLILPHSLLGGSPPVASAISPASLTEEGVEVPLQTVSLVFGPGIAGFVLRQHGLAGGGYGAGCLDRLQTPHDRREHRQDRDRDRHPRYKGILLMSSALRPLAVFMRFQRGLMEPVQNILSPRFREGNPASPGAHRDSADDTVAGRIDL